MILYEEEEFNGLIRPLMTVSRVIGIWPSKSTGSLDKFCKAIHLLVMFALLLSHTVVVTADTVHHRKDLNEATECGLIASAFYLTIVRMISFSVHQKQMSDVVEIIRSDWVLATQEERAVLREKCIATYKLARFFIFTVFTASGSFIIVSIIEIFSSGLDRTILPFRGYYFINHTISPIFECVYVINLASGILGSCTIASATSFSLIFVMHGAAKFSMLQRKLQSIKSTDSNSNRILAECIRQHQKSISFAVALEKIINWLALGQFLISSGLLCCAGFQLTSMLEDRGRLMKYTTFLNSAIIEMFLFSYSSDHLIAESTAVGDAAYCSDWVGCKFGISMCIIMIRSKISCKITAGKFYVVSMETFSTVLSTAFSYFTMLQAFNEE